MPATPRAIGFSCWSWSRGYQFRYWSDGQWLNDGDADAYVINRYGTDNFVVITDPLFRRHDDGG
ncbi:MAG: hypothetical protein RMN24_02100 [Anaerolineae bacterium]|nr:hypothetical protein [Anaerolineae bacterium]